MQHLRLTHPALDFWIDVRIREFNGRWLVVADLAGTPDVGTGGDLITALNMALAPFAEPLRAELVTEAEQMARGTAAAADDGGNDGG